MSEPSPDESLADVGVVLDGELGGIQATVQPPDGLTREDGEDEEGEIDEDTATVSEGCQGSRCRTGSHDVGNDEED